LFPLVANAYQVPSESWKIEGSGKSILINGSIAVARGWSVKIGEPDTRLLSSSTAETKGSIMLETLSADIAVALEVVLPVK
jgi:hypothetical protein